MLELDPQLAIASDLAYLDQNQLQVLAEQIYQVLGLLNRLIESLRQNRPVLR